MAPPKTGSSRLCGRCGRAFYVRPSEDAKAAARGNQPRTFCSAKCQHESYRGDGNPKWRGGTFRAVAGYIYAYRPEHPNATADGYVMQHRLVVEERIGRYLTATEEVHHINGIKDDNRSTNLELMPSKAAHRIRHGDYTEESCESCGKVVRRSLGHRRREGHVFCSRSCAATWNLERINT